jgi:hypothetical protein
MPLAYIWGDESEDTSQEIENHVANISGKLGFRSRSQVAAWAALHDLAGVEPSTVMCAKRGEQ